MLVLAVTFGATMALAETANAYQVAGSTWTWHRSDDVAKGSYGMQLDFEDRNDMNSGCDHFNISGSSRIFRYTGTTKITSVDLSDKWSMGTAYGSANFSLPPGVGFSTGSKSMTWDSTISGPSLTHNYANGNYFQVSTGSWWTGITHDSTGYYRVGATDYHLGKSRHETLC